jgi:hypothetical protein
VQLRTQCPPSSICWHDSSLPATLDGRFRPRDRTGNTRIVYCPFRLQAFDRRVNLVERMTASLQTLADLRFGQTLGARAS